MATEFSSFPIIDVSALVAKADDPKVAEDPAVREVVGQLDQACRVTGFFYVKGHGIPESMLKEVRELARKFFHLPLEEKKKLRRSPATGFRGYQAMGEKKTNGKPDIHEAINCYKDMPKGAHGELGKPMEGFNQWPEYPPNFKAVMEEYSSLCKELGRKILRGLALALGGSADEFERKIARDPFWAMRLLGYPATSPDAKDEGTGAHTDYGLVTILNQDEDVNALEVRNLSGEWITAPPIPGTFVCNIANMLRICSNGVYESTVHRVVNNSPKYRVSVVFFYETDFETPAEPLDTAVTRANGQHEYERAVYGEHIIKHVAKTYAGKS